MAFQLKLKSMKRKECDRQGWRQEGTSGRGYNPTKTQRCERMWPASGIMSNPGSGEQDVWVEGVRLKGPLNQQNSTGAHVEMAESHS